MVSIIFLQWAQRRTRVLVFLLHYTSFLVTVPPITGGTMQTLPPLPKCDFTIFEGCSAYTSLSLSYDGPIPPDLLEQAREYDRVKRERDALEASAS